MKLLNVLFPVHLALRLSDDEIAALLTRTHVILDFSSHSHELTEAEIGSIARVAGVLRDVQKDRLDGGGLDQVYAAKTVNDFCLLASPALEWAGPVPVEFFIGLCLLVNHLPFEIPQGEEQTAQRERFSQQVDEAINDPEYVAAIVGPMQTAMAEKSEAERRRPFRLRISVKPNPSS